MNDGLELIVVQMRVFLGSYKGKETEEKTGDKVSA